MAQALQQSETQMARAGTQNQTAQVPEMSGSDGFNPDGTPRKSGSQPGPAASREPRAASPGSGPGLGQQAGHGVGGKIPPVGAPTPGKKIDTLVRGQIGKGEP